MKNKLLIAIIILFFIISISTIVTAKYIIEYEKTVGKIKLDRTSPFVQVEYSTKEPTEENVLVTLNSDEPLLKTEGWILSEDKMKLTKSYENNTQEFITVQDLVGNKTDVPVDVNNIDKQKPYIELIETKNSNNSFENFASHIHNITFRIKIHEENIIENNLNINNIIVKVQNEISSLYNAEIKEIEKNNESIIYDINLKNVEGNGMLSLIIKDSIIMDVGNKVNEEFIINSEITIDNINPDVSYIEEKQESGKSLIIINSNETIRNIENWNKSQDNKALTKEFTNNISFILKIKDYAENISEIEIEIKQATFINITYASHNSEIGWSFGYGNNDIAGAEAISINPKYKTEALAFNVEGNIEKDFIKARAYVHNFWREGAFGKCRTTGNLYKYAYNPYNIGTKSMASDDLVTINDKKYFQFGGSGINQTGNTDADGNNPISEENYGKYSYGISGILFKLKDYSYYSIIYQIYVDGFGWTKVKSDGEEIFINHEEPMSAIRISLVPKTEKENVIALWTKSK